MARLLELLRNLRRRRPQPVEEPVPPPGPGSRALPLEPPVVTRLNRRAIYLVAAVLFLLFAMAIRAIHTRNQPAPRPAARPNLAAAPQRQWYDDVPLEAPKRKAAEALAPAPPPTELPPAPAGILPPREPGRPLAVPPAGPARACPEPDRDVERRHQAEVAAFKAAIAAPGFGLQGPARHAELATAASPAVTIAPSVAVSGQPAVTLPAASPAEAAPAPSTSPPPAPAATPASIVNPAGEALGATLRTPASPYEIKAGTVVPAVLLSAVNSDLPGQVIAQVRENVYDSATGQHLLLPQGARLVGVHSGQVKWGEERLFLAWRRIVLPDGRSLSLRDGMPGADQLGAAGLADEVNHHYLRVFGNALLLSIVSAGIQLSQVPDFGRDFRGPTLGNQLGAAVGQDLGQTATEFIRRGMNVAPTLELRPGYRFTVMVTQDLTFPGPYTEARRP